MSSVRFGIVGCGRIFPNHAQAIRRLPRAAIAAVCDVDATRAGALAERLAVPWYTSYHHMLAEESIDVVSIATPSGMHPPHALDAMQQYGKHVVIEKPMALRLDDLERLQYAASSTGCRIFPVYQNRYNVAVRKVHEEVQAGTLGKLVLGTVRVRWCRRQGYFDQDPWRATWALDGGCLTNQGIHFLDLLLCLMGDVETVSAFKATALARIEVEDTLVACVRFASGALGQLEVTTAARPDDFDAEVSVLGENGTAVIAGLAANRLTVWTPDPNVVLDYNEDFPDAYGSGHYPFYRDVVADLLDGVPHPVTFDEGARAVRLINAVYRSTELGVPVRVDDRPVSACLGRRDPELEQRYLSTRAERDEPAFE